MCKGNVVCFDCRVVFRRNTWRHVTHIKPETIGSTTSTRCPHCGKSCYFLGPSITVPRKRDKKSWEALRASTVKKRVSELTRRNRSVVHKKHDIEKQIAALESRRQNAGRKVLIKKLRSEYKQL
jgi:hypothetical protein